MCLILNFQIFLKIENLSVKSRDALSQPESGLLFKRDDFYGTIFCIHSATPDFMPDMARAIPAKVGTGFASGIALKLESRAFQAFQPSPETLYAG
jgi:hypothetical protein